MVGPYVSAIEHRLINHPSLVKGLDLKQRDDKLKPLNDFDMFFETDYQRFDMSISKPYLEQVEYHFLTLCFSAPEHFLFRVAMWMAQNTLGRSDFGLTYRVVGSRCSGDAFTSIGNGLANHFNTWVCMRNLPPDSWVSFHEGDDGIMGVKKQFVDQVCYNLHLLPVIGFQIKIEIRKSLEFSTFCGRFLMAEKGVVHSMCDFYRTISKIHTICTYGDDQALALAKMMSYYHTDYDTPLIGIFAYVFIRLYRAKVSYRRLKRAISNLRRDLFHREKFQYWHANCGYTKPQAPHYKRAVVALRTNLTISQQICYENYYLSFIKLGYIPARIHKLPADWTLTEDSVVHGKVCEYVL